jgi:hypothetical protein
VRYTAITGAPASARAVAIARPGPRLAPTTIIVLPDRSPARFALWWPALRPSAWGRSRWPIYYRRARVAVADQIEVFYNRQRLHTTLGYRTRSRHLPDSPSRSNRCVVNYPDNCPRSLTQQSTRLPVSDLLIQRASKGRFGRTRLKLT